MFKRKFGKRREKPQLSVEHAGNHDAIEASAVAHLARRDFCSGELRTKLIEEGYLEDIVSDVLADMAERRLIDDERYANQFVSYHADRGHGPGRIRNDLAGIGVPSELIQAALDAKDEEWMKLARDVRIRKFGAELPQTWPEKARQMRFLQYRGFSNDHIHSALGPELEPD